ncbi:phage tail tape measure protein [Paenibacillus larvae]|nr:phage tail tape measure protein [Paenibacillus larvae]MDT2306356.1 phage tail tape measure protein [Paenibacillus larvae]
MKSMPDLIAEIEKGTQGMTDQQKSATLSTLFGAEAYKHWAILLGRGSDQLVNHRQRTWSNLMEQPNRCPIR